GLRFRGHNGAGGRILAIVGTVAESVMVSGSAVVKGAWGRPDGCCRCCCQHPPGRSAGSAPPGGVQRSAAKQRGSPRPVLVRWLALHPGRASVRGGLVPGGIATYQRRRREPVYQDRQPDGQVG